MPKIKVDWVKCIGCGTCVDNCPSMVYELQDVVEYKDSKKSIPVRPDDCILCMTCVSMCPQGAIEVQE